MSHDMATLVYCKACGVGYPAIGALPDICPHCEAPAHWVTSLEPWPFPLSHNDKRFLKGVKIAIDED